MNKRLTYVVLGIFLILTGLLELIPGLSELGFLTPILAMVAGVLLLASRPGSGHAAGWIMAAIYLLLRGLSAVVALSFWGMDVLMSILALAAGVLLLIRAPKFKHHIGFFLFCIWLILVGLMGLIPVGQFSIIASIAAAASGVLLIIHE